MGDRGSRSGFEGMTNEERKRQKKIINEEDAKEFDDVAVEGEEGGWRFDRRGEEHGEEQQAWMAENTNVEEIIRGMKYWEKEAISDEWARGRFMRGQQYKGWDNMSEKEKALTQVYDRLLDQSVIKKGLIIRRLATAELILGAGNTKGSLKALQAMEGQVVVSAGNMSTAVAKEGLRISPTWDASKNVEYRIHIPSGSKGAGMWIGDHRVNHWGAIQREFMTNRDARFVVGKTTTRKDREGHTIHVVNLTYAGHLEHDYGKSGKTSYTLW